ncbi:MAG: amidohydrolase family protein [Ginsengibacter sp.]
MDNQRLTTTVPISVIDSHQHFWKFDPVRDSWINSDMSVIQKDFLPADLELIFKENNITGSVVVQSDQSEKENEFQLKNADAYTFIKGVVGWVDLRADDIKEKLIYYKQFKKLKGFRHVLQGELQRGSMLEPNFKRGIGLLHKYGFTYDLLIYPDQLVFAKELVSEFPDQRFVLDHIAKPDIKNKNIDEWKKDIIALGANENVYCKISGLVTEADWHNWTIDDFIPYIDVVVNAFGTKRIMYGSDWPVCLVAASYQKMKEIVDDYFSYFSKNEQRNFYGKTATHFYNL